MDPNADATTTSTNNTLSNTHDHQNPTTVSDPGTSTMFRRNVTKRKKDEKRGSAYGNPDIPEHIEASLEDVSFASFDFTAEPSTLYDQTQTQSQTRGKSKVLEGDYSTGFDGGDDDAHVDAETRTGGTVGDESRPQFDGTTSTVNYEDEFF